MDVGDTTTLANPEVVETITENGANGKGSTRRGSKGPSQRGARRNQAVWSGRVAVVSYQGSIMLSFFVGVLSSLFAVCLIKLFTYIRLRRKFGSLEGHWLEVIEGDPYHRFSIGRFSIVGTSCQYTGTEYDRSAGIINYWKSHELVVQEEDLRIYYIYNYYKGGSRFSQRDGFGVIDIKKGAHKSTWTATGGYFINIEDLAKPIHLKMSPAHEVAEKIEYKLDPESEENLKNFIHILETKNPNL